MEGGLGSGKKRGGANHPGEQDVVKEKSVTSNTGTLRGKITAVKNWGRSHRKKLGKKKCLGKYEQANKGNAKGLTKPGTNGDH